jgi:hypothetical protein
VETFFIESVDGHRHHRPDFRIRRKIGVREAKNIGPDYNGRTVFDGFLEVRQSACTVESLLGFLNDTEAIDDGLEGLESVAGEQ